MDREIYAEILVNLTRPSPDSLSVSQRYKQCSEIIAKVKEALAKLALPTGWKLDTGDKA